MRSNIFPFRNSSHQKNNKKRKEEYYLSLWVWWGITSFHFRFVRGCIYAFQSIDFAIVCLPFCWSNGLLSRWTKSMISVLPGLDFLLIFLALINSHASESFLPRRSMKPCIWFTAARGLLTGSIGGSPSLLRLSIHGGETMQERGRSRFPGPLSRISGLIFFLIWDSSRVENNSDRPNRITVPTFGCGSIYPRHHTVPSSQLFLFAPCRKISAVYIVALYELTVPKKGLVVCGDVVGTGPFCIGLWTGLGPIDYSEPIGLVWPNKSWNFLGSAQFEGNLNFDPVEIPV